MVINGIISNWFYCHPEPTIMSSFQMIVAKYLVSSYKKFLNPISPLSNWKEPFLEDTSNKRISENTYKNLADLQWINIVLIFAIVTVIKLTPTFWTPSHVFSHSFLALSFNLLLVKTKNLSVWENRDQEQVKEEEQEREKEQGKGRRTRRRGSRWSRRKERRKKGKEGGRKKCRYQINYKKC